MELPDRLYQKVVNLSERGDHEAEAERFDRALDLYRQAYALLPEPAEQWTAATWLLGAIGDAQFFSGDLTQAAETFRKSLNSADGLGNAFLHLRMGQCLFELGETSEAMDQLTRAYMAGGRDIFADQNPKYFRALEAILLPPPGSKTL